MKSPLRPADLEMFQAIGVTTHTAVELAGVRPVTHIESQEVCGIRYKSDHLEGLAFPYLNPDNDAIQTWRVRRDNPEVDSDGRPIAKYVSPPDRKHLYFAPGCYPHLADTSTLGILVESQKAVLSILDAEVRTGRRHALLIGTDGCWGWRGVRGKASNANGVRVDEKGPLPDLDRVTWTARDTIIAFDANAATNDKVQAARRALAAELEKRGAKVRIAALPSEDGINGPDDYIGVHGADKFFREIIDGAKPIASTKSSTKKEPKPKQGSDVAFEDVEPWPTPVDGAALLVAMVTTFERYLALPRHASTALALWVLHAYALDAFFISPILGITSPVKRCGKTLTLIVLGALVPRRMFAANVTPAVLFRTIEKYAPTLLIDEADTFIRDNDELRGVINSGLTRTTAVCIRAVGEDHDPRAFSTWCAKAIALIGKLPGTLGDRAIEVSMRRRTSGEHVTRLRQDRIGADCAELRQQAARWTDDHLQRLQGADPVVPDGLHDRAADCWRPLLAVADAIGGRWPALAREAAAGLSGESSDDEAGTLLLTDIQMIFADEGDPDVLGSTVLAKKLTALDDRPWGEWSEGRPISTAKIARLLAGYDIYSAGTIRVGAETMKGYRRAAFTEAWERYIPADPPSGGVKPSHRNKPNESWTETAVSNRHTQSACDGLQSVTNPMNTERSYGVTVSQGEEGDADLF